jgi:hypothetical protein
MRHSGRRSTSEGFPGGCRPSPAACPPSSRSREGRPQSSCARECETWPISTCRIRVQGCWGMVLLSSMSTFFTCDGLTYPTPRNIRNMVYIEANIERLLRQVVFGFSHSDSWFPTTLRSGTCNTPSRDTLLNWVLWNAHAHAHPHAYAHADRACLQCVTHPRLLPAVQNLVSGNVVHPNHDVPLNTQGDAGRNMDS